VARGVAKERLISKGFSSSVPVASNVTEAGREQNRRVEFIVHFIIVNDGSK
jgi:outer membrane protein OmpA-like peptidoglycan-associated protein